MRMSPHGRIPLAARAARAALVASALAGAIGAPAARAGAQLAPQAEWRTIGTEHFRVHFTPELEPLARRAAASAERAWAQLAAELTPPRGTVDIVVADNVDVSNGYATTFPTNRIVVFAHPPVDSPSLRFYDDWSALVVTHELAHVFHLDRTRGWWRVAQGVFGRSPFLFPNQYTPAWVTEGIAVYYESRLTGSGRVAGTFHRTLATEAARTGSLPSPSAVSLASSRFPGGDAAYAYGGLFIDYLARTRGDTTLARFVDVVAGAPVPFLLDRSARSAFGVSFTRAWREWRDSLAAGATEPPARGVFGDLTDGVWQAQGPRWLGDSVLVAGLNTGREVPGAYEVALDGRMRRVGRRNDASVNDPLAGGGLLYAQPDYVSPYELRNDLYVARGGRDRRLTHGARLSRPDARADGTIVAVQALPGTTRLVRVSPDGADVEPLTVATLDTAWAEPRWSPDGTRIAAVRWRQGGTAEVVVLDTLGAVERVVAGERAVLGAPAWTADGAAIVYASDAGGRSRLHRADLATGVTVPLGDGSAALFQPAPSPDGEHVAAVRYGADGWHVVAAPDAATQPADGVVRGAERGSTASRGSTLPPVAPVSADAAPTSRYSPWRHLVPRYWVPLVGQGAADELQLGGLTSAADVVGRHAYDAQLLVGVETGMREYALSYRYAGLGLPVIGAGWSQDWDRGAVRDEEGAVVGDLRRRDRLAAISATVMRPRVRTSAWLTIGAEAEWRDYRTDPEPLLERLDPVFRRTRAEPAVRISGGWSNARRPMLSISPEDGLSLGVTARQRWLDRGAESVTRSVVGTVSAYRSLPWLPGFAHHVMALRGSAGWADDGATSEFELGGVSGGTLEILPGIVVGDGARTFGVRGVPVGAAFGTRAVAGTVEYRAPVAAPGVGLAPLPAFFDRVSLAVFADAGAAWCPPSIAGRGICTGAVDEARWLGSVGAELDVDIALPYDYPYRFRLGAAVPRADARLGVDGAVKWYIAVGRAF
ncbi:MAG TPA: hypothetical protein VGE02_14770 [Gemmatimonadales bacterium]